MHTEKFGVSSKLQEIMCLLAQDCVFEEAAELLHKLLGIDICAKQIHRVSEHYGGELEELETTFSEGTADVPMVVSKQEGKYLIGSGAIESAHRNVIQQRLKLSGQRWSVEGAQKIANLRVYKKSNRWKEVIDQIKKAA